MKMELRKKVITLLVRSKSHALLARVLSQAHEGHEQQGVALDHLLDDGEKL